jgi:RimJ/RimL family protein N-acetyltransferase
MSEGFITPHQEAHPRVFVHLAITLHTSEPVIGWCGVKVDIDRQEAELGYALHRHYWGQGYSISAQEWHNQ